MSSFCVVAINSPAVLAQLDQASGQGPVLIFKHSTRCSISATALGRLERQWNEAAGIRPYFLGRALRGVARVAAGAAH